MAVPYENGAGNCYVSLWELRGCPSLPSHLLFTIFHHISIYFTIWSCRKMGVPPKSSTLIGCSLINHPFWGYPGIPFKRFKGTRLTPQLTISAGPSGDVQIRLPVALSKAVQGPFKGTAGLAQDGRLRQNKTLLVSIYNVTSMV